MHCKQEFCPNDMMDNSLPLLPFNWRDDEEELLNFWFNNTLDLLLFDDAEEGNNNGINQENVFITDNDLSDNESHHLTIGHDAEHSFSPPNGQPNIFIEEHQVRAHDVFCGRSFTGTDHQGNIEYLQMIEQYWALHQSYGTQHRHKTAIRNIIIDNVIRNGGRFIRRTRDGQRFELLTLKEAERKVSQALRDPRRNNKSRNAKRRNNNRN